MTFEMIVEADRRLDRLVTWPSESPPDVIVLGGELFILVGQLLSGKPDQFSYRRPTVLDLKA